MSELQVIWFLLIGVLLTGYAILDGFDLGVGFWHLFTRKSDDRRTLMSTIGPVWDGNEVWLLTGGGALFAAFPHVYATVFSGLYLPLMVVLFALIFRAVSMEARNKIESPGWHRIWDIAFGLGSVIPGLLFGVAVGNILRGLPLDASNNFAGTLLGLLNPYSLLMGVVGLAMFATHGALYAWAKTTGDLSESIRKRARASWYAFFLLFLGTSACTIFTQPHLVANWNEFPPLFLILFLTLFCMLLTRSFISRSQSGKAFTLSCFSIVGVMAINAVSVFPNLVPALDDPQYSLTIANASSSPLTLKTMLIIAAIGMPIVLAYSLWAHKTFGGKVEAGSDGY